MVPKIQKNALITKTFKKFTAKYGIGSLVMVENFETLEIRKDEFNKDTLKEQIENLVCKGRIKEDLLYRIDTKYQGNEFTPGTPMSLFIYTEQWCSDDRFQKDLDEFVDKIMEIYNNKSKIGIETTLLGIEAIYIVNLPRERLEDGVAYFVALSIEKVYEGSTKVYVQLGLWG
jgi:hypothetical protein